jgi:uncharacterized protein (DUF488 family)
VEIFTIGFTKSSARDFFGRLTAAGIQRLVDVRLNNTSQLALFAKRNDLEYFLESLCGVRYVHEPLLAPTPEILTAYKKQNGDWEVYRQAFLNLIAARQIENRLDPTEFRDVRSVLLCSEDTPGYCHRRLVVEYLQSKWPDVRVVHL